MTDEDDDTAVLPRPRLLARTMLTAVGAIAAVVSIFLFMRVFIDPDLDDVPSEFGWVAAPFETTAHWHLALTLSLAITTALIALAGIIGASAISRSIRTRTITAPSTAFGIDRDLLESELMAEDLTLDQAVAYWEMVHEPQARFARITEQVEAGTRSIRVTSTFSITTQGLRATPYVFPLMMCSRGRLEHGLEFSDSGTRTSSLSHLQSSAYSIRVVRRLIQEAGRAALAEYERPCSGGESLADRVQRVLISAQPTPEADATAIAQAVVSLPAKKKHRDLLFGAGIIVLTLAEQYPLCVSLTPAPNTTPTVRLSVKRVIIPELRNYDLHPVRRSARLSVAAAARRAEQRLRNSFGIPPNSIDYQTALAARAASYHLTVRGPEGMYLAQQEIRDNNDGGRSVRRSALASLSYAMTRRRGQRTAHLYARNGHGFRDLIYSCRFYERMPGSMSTAFVGAATTTLIASAIATYALYGGQEITGFLQILLAFPLALTATSSYRQGAPFWGGDLGARAATVITVLVLSSSLWASILGTMNVPHGVQASLWAWILVVSATNTLICLIAWIARASTQHHFLQRPDRSEVSNA